ncbi:hypothetical protein Tco_0797820 [Tanacetum coccineum]
MAEIGWARIGPSKSSQSLSNAHKWAVVIDLRSPFGFTVRHIYTLAFRPINGLRLHSHKRPLVLPPPLSTHPPVPPPRDAAASQPALRVVIVGGIIYTREKMGNVSNDDCKEIGEIHQEVRVCEIGSGLLKDNNDKAENDENCSNLAKENDNQDKCDLSSDGENQLNHPINLMNIPLEAWTTRMCTQRMGRLEYARVLVEVHAQKGLEDYIDVLYKCKEDGKQFVKKLRV